MLAGAVCFVVLAVTSAAQAAGPSQPPRPQPQKLWDAYPLDAQPRVVNRPRRGPATAAEPAPSSGRSSDVLLWVAVTAFAAALVAFAVGWRHSVRRRLPLLFGPLRVRSGARPRRAETLALAGDGAAFDSPQEVVARFVSAARNGRTVESGRVADSVDEYAVLKRKRAQTARSETEKLRAKERLARGQRRDDVTVLKAKRANGSARERAVGRCRIDWSRGPVESEFHAAAAAPSGDAVVLTSPPFPWDVPTPPSQDVPEAARAHATLVAELESAGWVAKGQGDTWYSLEFEKGEA